MKNRSLIVTAAAGLLLGAAAVAQEVGHTTTWSKADDLAGFEALEGGKLVWVAEGGNPGGFVRTVKTGTVIPKPYLRSDLRRVFGTGAGSISFDLKALGDGSLPGGRLFLSTGGRAFSYDFTTRSILGHDQTGADGWRRYSIPFKTDWTEAEALAQGWHPFSGEVDKWADVLANPVWSTLRMGENVGIDNFRMDGGKALDAAALRLIEPPPPQEKPVVNYAFDEGAGDVLHDRAGYAPDGKISGAKWVRYGGRWALEFDGVGDSVNCGVTDVVGPQTLVAWVWAEPMYSVWQSTPILGGGYSIAQRCFTLHAGGTGNIPVRKWTHIAVVWDGSTARLYVDGTLGNVVVCKEPAAGRELVLAPARPLLEGEPPEYAQRFKGKMAGLVLYNRPLSQEEVLKDLLISNITNSPMTMSIPQPGLNTIKVETDAGRLGQPLENVAVTVDVLKAGQEGGQPVVSAVVKQFNAAGRAVVDISAPNLAKGEYVVRATARDAAGKTLGVAGEEPLSWAGSVNFPSGPEGARKLNNLVTDLLAVPGPDNSGAARSFVNPRTGFIFVSNRGSQEVKIAPEGTAEAITMPLFKDYGDAFEAFRYLPKGKYTITVPIAQELTVRAVAQTVYDYAYTQLPVGNPKYVYEFGPYHGEFEEHYVFPHYNTFLVHGYNIDKPFAKEWKARGRRYLDYLGTGSITAKEGQSQRDALCEILGGGRGTWLGFSNPMYDGYLVDEFAASSEGHRVWSQALEKLLSQPQFKGKALNSWTYAYYDLVTYFGGAPGREFVKTLKKFDSPIQWECYLDSQRTELDALRLVNEKIVGEAMAADQVFPGMVESLIVVPYSGVNAGPNWLTMTLPGYNTRAFLEMQVRAVATHPFFANVRGLGIYRSPYMDEETHRWMARLFRHYAIEGRTEPLGKDPFLLTHIMDGEFEQPEKKYWTLSPAEEGSIEYGMRNQLGSIQCRYTGQNGDTMLAMRRSDKAPNVFSQESKGLEAGRLYSFRMFSVDKNMSNKVPNVVNIRFDNATPVPEKCFDHLGASRRENCWLNWHVRVFRAKGPTATLRVSDWADDKVPGGPIGQELMYNFIKVQPYWPAD